jgi:hypothetical protein
MDDGAATEKGTIPNVNVARQEHGVGDYDTIADVAIVRYVAGGHQKTICAYFSKAARFRCPTDSDVFSNDSARADPYAGDGRSLEAEILRITADNGKRMNDDVLAKRGVPADYRVRMYYTTVSKPGSFLDQSCRMNLHDFSVGAKIARRRL